MITGKKKAAAKPRISVNKLAEYLEASATRRKKIVEDAKNPEKYITTRYKDARSEIRNYLSGKKTEDEILKAIEKIGKQKTSSDFQEQDKKLSVESLESLLESDQSLPEGCEAFEYDKEGELLEISGVKISVSPDLILYKNVDGVVHAGALKIHISKTNTLNTESQKIVAVILYLFTQKFIIKSGQADSPKLCFSFDVFTQQLESCPSAYKQRLKKVEAACEEISLWWDKL